MNEHLIWNELGNINSKMGNIDKAMESFQKAIEIESAFGLSFNNLGICYQMKEKYPEAILLYQKSLDLLINDKESALVWKRMGEAYASIGDYARSLDAYQNSNDLISKTAQDKQSDSSWQEYDENELKIWLQKIETNASSKIETIGSDPILEENTINASTLTNLEIDLGGPESDSAIENENDSEETVSELAEESIEDDEPEIDEISLDEPASDEHEKIDDDEQTALEWHKLDSNESPKVEEYSVGESNNEYYAAPSEDDNNTSTISPLLKRPRLPIRLAEQPKDIAVWPKFLSKKDPWFENNNSEVEVIEHEDLQPENEKHFDKLAGVEVSEEIIEPSENNFTQEKSELSFQTSQEGDLNEVAEIVDEPSADRKNGSDEIPAAVEIYEKITQQVPTNDKAWDKLGNLYKDMGRYDKAKAAYEKAVSISNKQPIYQYHLGLVYSAQNQYEYALSIFQGIVELDPKYILAHCALAGCYRRLKLESDLEEHINIARPHMLSESEYNRACFESISGNTDDAIHLLGIALENEQTTIKWIIVDPDLDFIRDDPRFRALIGQVEIEDAEVAEEKEEFSAAGIN